MSLGGATQIVLFTLCPGFLFRPYGAWQLFGRFPRSSALGVPAGRQATFFRAYGALHREKSGLGNIFRFLGFIPIG